MRLLSPQQVKTKQAAELDALADDATRLKTRIQKDTRSLNSIKDEQKAEKTKLERDFADFKATMAKIDSPIQYLDAPEFGKYWAADARRLAEVVKTVGRVEEHK